MAWDYEGNDTGRSRAAQQPFRQADAVGTHQQVDSAALGPVVRARTEKPDARGRIKPGDPLANRIDVCPPQSHGPTMQRPARGQCLGALAPENVLRLIARIRLCCGPAQVIPVRTV